MPPSFSKQREKKRLGMEVCRAGISQGTEFTSRFQQGETVHGWIRIAFQPWAVEMHCVSVIGSLRRSPCIIWGCGRSWYFTKCAEQVTWVQAMRHWAPGLFSLTSEEFFSDFGFGSSSDFLLFYNRVNKKIKWPFAIKVLPTAHYIPIKHVTHHIPITAH